MVLFVPRLLVPLSPNSRQLCPARTLALPDFYIKQILDGDSSEVYDTIYFIFVFVVVSCLFYPLSLDRLCQRETHVWERVWLRSGNPKTSNPPSL